MELVKVFFFYQRACFNAWRIQTGRMRPKDPKKINKMGLHTYVDSFWGLKEVTSSKSNKIIMIVCGRISLDLGSLPRLERFFSGYSGFPLSSKSNIFSNSNSIWNARTRFNEFSRTPKCFDGKKKNNNNNNKNKKCFCKTCWNTFNFCLVNVKHLLTKCW